MAVPHGVAAGGGCLLRGALCGLHSSKMDCPEELTPSRCARCIPRRWTVQRRSPHPAVRAASLEDGLSIGGHPIPLCALHPSKMDCPEEVTPSRFVPASQTLQIHLPGRLLTGCSRVLSSMQRSVPV